MSIHRSLVSKKSGLSKRTVLTRFERIQKMLKEGRWREETDSAFGLPKLRIYVVKRRKKVKKQKETEKTGV